MCILVVGPLHRALASGRRSGRGVGHATLWPHAATRCRGWTPWPDATAGRRGPMLRPNTTHRRCGLTPMPRPVAAARCCGPTLRPDAAARRRGPMPRPDAAARRQGQMPQPDMYILKTKVQKSHATVPFLHRSIVADFVCPSKEGYR
jgi:hypothetical protein